MHRLATHYTKLIAPVSGIIMAVEMSLPCYNIRQTPNYWLCITKINNELLSVYPILRTGRPKKCT